MGTARGHLASRPSADSRRLRVAFGFVEVLAVVDHEADQVEDDDEAVED